MRRGKSLKKVKPQKGGKTELKILSGKRKEKGEILNH